jgi:curved DNA-binding protein CbpA
MAADPYAILGVAPAASDPEVRTAYRRLVQLHHPDHNHGSHESALRFAEVQEAYAHVRLLRRRADPPPSDGPASTSELDRRLAAMEAELRHAKEQREQAARTSARARQAATARARSDRDRTRRPSPEELGYISTDDSFTKILDDVAEEVSARFSEARDVPRAAGSAPRPHRPKSLADWIDELGSRLSGAPEPERDPERRRSDPET